MVPFGGGDIPEGDLNYEDLLAGAGEDFQCPAIDENDGAMMCYTSGTTGNSKGVLYSHRAHCPPLLRRNDCRFLRHQSSRHSSHAGPDVSRDRLGLALFLRDGRRKARSARAQCGRRERAQPDRSGTSHLRLRRAHRLARRPRRARKKPRPLEFLVAHSHYLRRLGAAGESLPRPGQIRPSNRSPVGHDGNDAAGDRQQAQGSHARLAGGGKIPSPNKTGHARSLRRVARDATA